MPNLSNQRAIDQFNAQLRANPQYQAWLRQQGVDPSGPIRLTDQQRKNAEAWVRRTYGDIGNLQVDPAGNLNQDEGFSKHKTWIIPAAIGAATLGAGALGAGPAAGLFGGGSGAASASGAAASGVLPSSSLPTASLMGGPAAASAGLSGAAGAAGAAGGSAALGGVVPSALAGGGGLTGRLLDNLLSPEGLLTAGSIAAQLATGGDGTNEQTRASEEQARRLQQITEARMRRVDPLHEAVTQLAFSRLPVSSRNGIMLPRVALPE